MAKKCQNIEFREVIKAIIKEGTDAAKEIYSRMAGVYGNSSPKYSTVAKWSAEFKRGRESLKDDDLRPDFPDDEIRQGMVDRIKRLVVKDRRIKIKANNLLEILFDF